MTETATIHPVSRAIKNPLVGDSIGDTAHNVACLLKYLEGFVPDTQSMPADDDDYAFGYSLMNRLLIDALESHKREDVA